MFAHLPSLNVTLDRKPEFLSDGKLTSAALLRVASTLMVGEGQGRTGQDREDAMVA
jgi:hypothetical protein